MKWRIHIPIVTGDGGSFATKNINPPTAATVCNPHHISNFDNPIWRLSPFIRHLSAAIYA